MPYTTINNIATTNIEYNSSNIGTTDLYQDEPTFVVLLGFSQFKRINSSFIFYTYFTPTRNVIHSKAVSFPDIISYNTNSVILKEASLNTNNTNDAMVKESVTNCTLKSLIGEKNYQYFCEIQEDTEDINQIKIIPDFNFVEQKNITVIGISPFSKMFMNNLQLLANDNTDIFFNSTVYVLDNSNIDAYNKMLFNISGTMNEPLPELLNKNLSIMINLLSDNRLQTEVNCIIKNITGLNYEFYCKANETLEADMQSAISFFEKNKILIINFIHTNSIIKTESAPISLKAKKLFFKFFNKKSGLSPAVIAALIIVLLVVSFLTLFLVIYFKRRQKKKNKHAFDMSSTIYKLKFSN